MSMRSPTVQLSDLSARTKIREAALSLFGTEGFAVSVRAIADMAGCSPGLVIHHFGNKDGLREAVDQSVMDTLLQNSKVSQRSCRPISSPGHGRCLFGRDWSEPRRPPVHTSVAAGEPRRAR